MSKPLTMTVEQEKADRAASRFMDRCGMAEADSADAAALRAWTEVDALRAALAAAEAKLADERRHADALLNALRDALEKVIPDMVASDQEYVRALLAQTPAASLRSHDAEVLERAATCAESFLWNLPAIQSQVGANCGDAIRALAAQEDAENCSLSHEQIGEALRAAHENQLRRVGDAEAGFASDSAQGVKP